MLRPLLSVWLVALVVGARQLGGSINVQLGVIALWGTGMAFVQARRIIVTLYRSTDLSAFFYLPITNESMFRWERQKFARGASWLLCDFVAAYFTCASGSTLGAAGRTAAVLIAVVQCLVVVSFATLLMIHRPRWPYEQLAVLLFFALLLMSIFGEYMASWLVPAMERLSPLFYVVLPSGWVSAVFRQLLPGTPALAWVLLIPIGALIRSLPPSWGRLRSAYAFSEPVLAKSPDDDPSWQVREALALAPLGNHRAGPTEIEDSIRDRDFLRPMAWKAQGWIERLVGRWLGLREKVIVEFMMARVPRWTIMWRKAGIAMLIGLLAGWVWQRTGDDLFPLAYVAAGIVAFFLALPVSSGFDRGFQAWFMSRTSVPFYACFPVGYREIARAALKIAAVRCLAMAPLAAVYGMIVAWQWAEAPGLGIVLGLKAVFLVFAARPMLMAFRFSTGTSDTKNVGARPAVILGAAILCTLMFATGSGLALFPSWQLSLVGALTAVGASTGFSAIYRKQYDRHRFDLIQLSR